MVNGKSVLEKRKETTRGYLIHIWNIKLYEESNCLHTLFPSSSSLFGRRSNSPNFLGSKPDEKAASCLDPTRLHNHTIYHHVRESKKHHRKEGESSPPPWKRWVPPCENLVLVKKDLAIYTFFFFFLLLLFSNQDFSSLELLSWSILATL